MGVLPGVGGVYIGQTLINDERRTTNDERRTAAGAGNRQPGTGRPHLVPPTGRL